MLPAPEQKPLLWLAAVLLMTFAAYVPSLGNGFTMDDRYVALGDAVHEGEGNPLVREPRPIADYFRHHYWHGHARSSRLFRPITTLSFAIRYRIAGDRAWVGHLFNILLHVLATWLVWRCLTAMRAPPVAALIGTLVFGLHAIHSEAVAGLVGRAELLAFCFGTGAMLLLHRGLPWCLPAAGLLFLAFGSKESALAFVGLAPAFAIARRAINGAPLFEFGGRHAWRLAAIAVPVAAFFWIRAGALAGLPEDSTVNQVVNPLLDAPAATRIATAIVVLGYGLLLNLLPFRLCSDYGADVFPIVDSFASPWPWLVAATLLAVVAFGLASTRTRPLLFLAVATFFGCSFITSNIPFSIGTIFGERLFYTSSAGIAFATAWIASRVWLPRTRTGLAACATAWLATCCLIIVQRSNAWASDARLFVTDAGRQPTSVRLQVGAAVIHQREGRPEQAILQLERAIELDPGYPDAWNNLAAAWLSLGQHARARDVLERALKNARPRDLEQIADQIYANLGFARAELGDREGAISALELAARSSRKTLGKRAEIGRFLARVTHDRSLDRAVRERAARLGLAVFGPGGPPK